jgi:hypothetical protein
MGLREGRGGEGKGREINYPSFFWIPEWECKLIFSCLFNGW